MSDKKTKRLNDSDIVVTQPNRRSVLGLAVGVAAAGLTAGIAGVAEAQSCTDRDPLPHGDPVGRGRSCQGVTPRVTPGVSDRDPHDPPGYGQGTRPGQSFGYRGISDRDPTDPPGYGRGSGITDRDPSDPPGYGRGGRR